MKIALIGTGHMASGLAHRIAGTSHSLIVRGRDLRKAAELARAVGAAATDGALEEADVVILATRYADAIPALRMAGGLAGKIVVDITNPLTADFSGLSIGFDTSAAEQIQSAVPEARVVKAFNTLFASVLAGGTTLDGKPVPVFVAADDAAAKRTVITLIEDMGYQAVDAGTLKNARLLEPLGAMNVYLGYGAGRGTGIAPTWIGV